MCIFLPDLPCSSYLCLCVLRFIGFLWGWHWGCWKTGASSRNKAELCVMHARRRFCFQRREDGRRELIYTQCHRREWAETQGYRANYSPCREAGVPPPFPREEACRDEILRERDANDKYSRNWRRILNPIPAASSRRAVTMVTSIIRLSLVTLDIQKYTFFPSFCVFFTSILCVPNKWTLCPGCLRYVHFSISLNVLNTRWMMLVGPKSSFFAAFLGSRCWCCSSNRTEATQHNRRW